MNVGDYHLGQKIDTTSSRLHELTEIEYRALPRTFHNERIFHAEQLHYADFLWDSLLATIDGRLYKIALIIDTYERPQSERIFFDTLPSTLVKQFGQPSERKGESSYIWDKDWGNVVYTQTNNRLYAIYFTSNIVGHTLSVPEVAKSLTSPFLSRLRRTLFWNALDYTDEENRRWLWLRAIEWNAWPTFISQPIVPVLLIFFSWWHVLVVLLLINIVWTFIRYKYVNFYLVELGVFFVKMKWPAAILCTIFLITGQRYGVAILAILWPLVAGIVGIPGKIGQVEILLAKKIGYVSEDAEP